MITIKKANDKHIDVLALLGTITYNESHGHYIDDKEDLKKYLETAFSVPKTSEDLKNPENLFYIIYLNKLPIGYAKLRLNSSNDNVDSKKSCQLERIYILNEFIPLKIGQQFLTFLENIANKLQFDTIWLSVYEENRRALRFYQKNDFVNIGKSTFTVNGKGYENIVLSKKI